MKGAQETPLYFLQSKGTAKSDEILTLADASAQKSFSIFG